VNRITRCWKMHYQAGLGGQRHSGGLGAGMRERLIEGKRIREARHFARGRCEARSPNWRRRWKGNLTEHHRFMLRLWWKHWPAKRPSHGVGRQDRRGDAPFLDEIARLDGCRA